MSRRLRRSPDQQPGEGSLPVDSSWRMVDGEHDSFDTTILPSLGPEDDFDDDVLLSRLSSQGNNACGGSQDSIRDFAKHQDDDQVILREPFRPSMLITPSHSHAQRSNLRTPDPQFRMPLVDTGRDGTSSGASSRTARPFGMGTGYEGGDGDTARRRGLASLGSPAKKQRRRAMSSSLDDDDGFDARRRKPARGRDAKSNTILAALPSTVYKLCAWMGEVVFIAMTYAKYPLGALLAVYLVFGSLIVAQNMATRSIYAAVSPLCRIPASNGSAGAGHPVEFNDLMGVQSQFEQVLERSADGVSLPFEMKRSEAAVRDLRSLVRHSDIQARHELVLEFDGYIEATRRAASDLQKFSTHVGSAVDSVISINRWTSRYIDSLAPSAVDGGPSALAEWSSWLFAPFQPAVPEPFSERAILDKYIEHTALVSDRIATLILEAQAILRLLTKAEAHLALIYDISSRSEASVASRRDEILWTIWTLVGANSARLHGLARQLALLRQVDAQRSSAVAQVSALVLELEAIQAGLGDLRDRVAEPQLVAASPRAAHIPLAVHIETIDRGVERLQAARARIRAAEDERVRDAVARIGGSKMNDDRLIDSRGGR
ncbi:uncharacterized protein HRG_06446 [Hirsutella rhossiliensis]|uniref:Uncharacterized protein n=1 Tax=Hirsutella rhossiliensis TaxID=111463 RepID=A0A9P8SHN6_9HYPO|nr:uncharacterized protein HRG_06446 [Hirsutella rhossiliensis]KAH0962344.1 hypothetical protein HRG_06446 [Hirsutella rhossiliensis]